MASVCSELVHTRAPVCAEASAGVSREPSLGKSDFGLRCAMRFVIPRPLRLDAKVKVGRTVLTLFLGVAALSCEYANGQPLDIEPRLQAAIDSRLTGDAARAADLLQQLAEDAPENADIQVQLGFALLALGELGRAKGAFERALALAPDYVDANLGLALIAFRSEDFDLAETQALVVLRSRSDPDAARLVDQIAAARSADRTAPAARASLPPATSLTRQTGVADLAVAALPGSLPSAHRKAHAGV